MLFFRNAALIAFGSYFLICAVRSGNIGSIAIGLVLFAICMYVVLTGKVHKKFNKNAQEEQDTKVRSFSFMADPANRLYDETAELFGKTIAGRIKEAVQKKR